MTVRAYVTFEDALTQSDGAARDDSPPGRRLADALAHGLETRGLLLTRPVSQWESYGWEFTVTGDGREVWFLLQRSDEWLLISEVRRRVMERIRGAGGEEQHRKAMDVLASVLAEPRFTKVRWFTKTEFENGSGGAGSPAS